MSEVKGQGHILYPESNQCTSFSFHINRTNHSFLRYGQNSAWPWKKHIWNLKQNFAKTTVFVQISKFLLINATAVTLGQGHGKVIQYISPDPYILCAKYQRYSSNGFDVRGKSFCSGGCSRHGGHGGRSGNQLKTYSQPQTGVTWLAVKIAISTLVKGMSTGSHCWDYHPGTISSKSSLCDSFEDWAPIDIICRCPIVKWVAVT